MKNIFIPSQGLNSLFDWLVPCLDETNWLFVAMDSSRDDFSGEREFLTPQLEKERIEFWWEDEGLWLPGKELHKAPIVVGFTAAFVFPSTIKHSAKPMFNDTTDRGEFTESQLKAVIQEINNLQASAYVADGSGLQCIFADENLYKSIPHHR